MRHLLPCLSLRMTPLQFQQLPFQSFCLLFVTYTYKGDFFFYTDGELSFYTLNSCGYDLWDLWGVGSGNVGGEVGGWMRGG